MFNEKNYLDILKRQLEERCTANPRYSLRALARDLKMSSGRLSSILNSKLGLSEASAKDIAKKLGFSKEETDYFCNLVVLSDGRSKIKRTIAASQIAHLQESRSSEMINFQLESFRIISDWYHFAIMELTTLKDFKYDVNWIAKRLGISKYETENAIGRLKKLGLLEEKKGHLVQTQVNLATPSEIPSESLKAFHAQVLRKAAEALALQAPSERDITNLTVAIDSRDLPEFKERIRKFRREFNRSVETRQTERDEVYMLAIQFFRLTEKE